MSYKVQAAALVGALAATVKAHGHVSGAVVDGQYYQGYDPSFQYQTPAPEVIGWSNPQGLDNGFVDPSMYGDVAKIACHKDATAGKKVAQVKAGGTIDLQWTTWPDSHVGPVIDYLAKVDDATTTDSASLNFFKIDEAGYDGSEWAATKLIANNNTWTVTIPTSIADGQYVLRHEIIALHSAGDVGGAQNYPQCLNIEVTGGGSETPAGVTADKFYTETDPGIQFSVYGGDLSGYQIPGPALFDGAGSGSGSGSGAGNSTGSAPAASSPAVQNAAADVAPAATSSASAPAATGNTGSGALPEEFTLDTFIAWLRQEAGSSSGSAKVRRHPRAFRG
ncbi:hypothetical protein BS50DRAFT_363216 [Corynespora cassiicola Philippines]|uniref:AA9 family lytic polysaccharide monooxygenase n=1 Tax=Corynespora cassiicola Philippines TaxID=1448308 RepID=A0A2T2NSP1_CORCC|nr:hypothetical protein BS50DRAFT_363216 [Corynespora cassiicola Philippines]